MAATVSIIDNINSINPFLDSLEDQPINPPSFYLDIEGIRLGRHGSISILQLYHLPQNHVYLVDIFVLGSKAFDTANRSGTTFRTVLESANVPKVFFDVRNDSDALHAQFGVKLQGVHDVQLLEVATRRWNKTRLTGLATCIIADLRLSIEDEDLFNATKKKGHALFNPDQGGSYECFNARPISQDLVDYCVQDVTYLPKLFEQYTKKIAKSTLWKQRVKEETERRVLLAQSETCNPNEKDKGFSPWPNQGQKSQIRASHRGSRNDQAPTGTASQASKSNAQLTIGQDSIVKGHYRKLSGEASQTADLDAMLEISRSTLKKLVSASNLLKA